MSSLLENPYVGPRTFTEEDKYFFGRDQEARDLLALTAAEKLVLFYAQSGAGKSSLINVKIAPGLRKRGFEVLPVSRVSGELPAGISPDEVTNIFIFNLLLSLNNELPPELKQTTGALTGQRLADFLQAEDAPLPDDGGQFYYELVPYVLIIDQFEELMTRHPGRWPERAGFFEQLQEAMARHPNLWVVLSIREDYVTALDPYTHYLANRLRARFYMQQLGRPAALEAIKKPAEGEGRPFAAGVAEALVDNLRHIQVYGQSEPRLGQFVEPVRLQVVCYRLWEDLNQKGGPVDQITAQDVQAIGDVDTTLAQFYEQVIADTIQETGVSEIALRDWFEHQVITEVGTRGMVYRGEEETGGLPTPTIDFVASKFLLRPDVRSGGTWYELVHDRFVEPISAANQRWRERQPLIQVAQAWVDSGRSDIRLLEGLPLQEALASNWQAVGPLVAEFLEASQRRQGQKEAALRAEREAQARALETVRRLAEEQEARAREQAEAAAQSRRLAIWLAVVGAIAVILAIVAAVFGIQATQSAANARRNEATALAARAEADNEREAAVTAQAEAEAAEATAEAARQEIAQQNEAIEAEIQFSQTADPDERLVLLDTLFGGGQDRLARRLFLELSREAQTTLQTTFEDSPATYPNLAQAGLNPITDSKGVKMVLVESGPFEMGSESGADDEKPAHTVTLGGFYIDQYEVTNAQFALFLNDEGNQEEGGVTWLDPGWALGRIQQTGGEWQAEADFTDHPVVGVSWYGAKAYCQWRGGRLPTEAEWEKAARGTDGRTYPWGEDIDDQFANYASGGTMPAGSYPDGVSPYGAYDMAGNVWEWVQSEYRDYPYRADDGRETLDSTNARVLRGGGWDDVGAFVRAASRVHGFPDYHVNAVGVRCVIAPGVGF